MDNDIYTQLPAAILPWYQQNKRDLPWRKDQEPYHVWVSEIMLQQTRVEAVKGYYNRFLQALPTIADLAQADDELLHKLWEGLGYYSRVRNLKKCAQVIMENYEDKFPRTYEEIIKLPGIGEYTAGAICSISFGLPTPAVDGNVMRVVSRLTADATPIDLPQQKKAVRLALEKIYPQEAGAFTQALMELGATLCGPNKKPECALCPCNAFCLGHIREIADTLPVKLPKRGRREEDKTVFILECNGRLALEKRPNQGLLADLWQFPNYEGKLDVSQALEIAAQMGVKPRELLRTVEKKHIFTHIQWNMLGVYIKVDVQSPQFSWFSIDELTRDVALPTAFRQFYDDMQ